MPPFYAGPPGTFNLPKCSVLPCLQFASGARSSVCAPAPGTLPQQISQIPTLTSAASICSQAATGPWPREKLIILPCLGIIHQFPSLRPICPWPGPRSIDQTLAWQPLAPWHIRLEKSSTATRNNTPCTQLGRTKSILRSPRPSMPILMGTIPLHRSRSNSRHSNNHSKILRLWHDRPSHLDLQCQMMASSHRFPQSRTCWESQTGQRTIQVRI